MLDINDAQTSLHASVRALVQVLNSSPFDCGQVLRLANRIAGQAFNPELKAVATRLQDAAVDPSREAYEHHVRTATHILLLMLEGMQTRRTCAG